MAGDLCEKGRPMGRGDGVGATGMVFLGVEAAGAFEAVAMMRQSCLFSHTPFGISQKLAVQEGLRGEHIGVQSRLCDCESALS